MAHAHLDVGVHKRADNMKDFLDGAKGLARNPLGIIALFLALIYGCVTALVGFATASVDAANQRILVVFVAGFPLVVLAAFFRLVTHHHGKLYGPRDYRDEASFLRTLRPEQQAARLDQEADQVKAEAALVPASATASSVVPLEPDESIRDLILEADSLAVRKLAATRGINVHRQITLGDGLVAAFDGAASTSTEHILIEVKYTRVPWVSSRLVQGVLRHVLAAEAVLRRGGDTKPVRLLLILVARDADEPGLRRLRSVAEAHLSDAPLPVELEVYSLEALRREFR